MWKNEISKALLLLCASSAMATDQSWATRDRFNLQLGLGMGELQTPITQHRDRTFYLLPQLSWYGEKFYFENGLFGYALDEHREQQWDVVWYPNDDGLLYHLNAPLAPTIGIMPTPYPAYPDRISILQTPERDISTMLGLRFAQQLESFDWSAQLAHDVSHVHDGWELSMKWHRANFIEAGDLGIDGDAGIVIKSAELIDYYYTPVFGEIAPMEGELWQQCDDQFNCELRRNGPYKGQTGFRLHASVAAHYTLTSQWTALLLYRHHFMSHQMSDTPLVTRAHYAAWFSGLQYRF